MISAPLRDYATHGFGRFACVWKDTGAVIGFCGPKLLPEIQEVELGYRLLPPYWGKGVATEATTAVIAYARGTLGLRRLIALVHPENAASARVLAKMGFSVERKATVEWFPGVELELDLHARTL